MFLQSNHVAISTDFTEAEMVRQFQAGKVVFVYPDFRTSVALHKIINEWLHSAANAPATSLLGHHEQVKRVAVCQEAPAVK